MRFRRPVRPGETLETHADVLRVVHGIVFGYCAVAYIVGWCCMKGLVPHYKKVEL